MVELVSVGWGDVADIRMSLRAKVGWKLLFVAFLVLSIDWWRWGRLPVLLGGIPGWVAYFAALGVLLAVAFVFFGRAVLARSGVDGEPSSSDA